MAQVPAPAIPCGSHVARGSGGGWLTSAQGQGSGGRGPAGSPLLAQAALQLPELLLLLQHGVLALPPGLPAEVLLVAQAPGRLSDLQLQGQLLLQAAQGVLGRRERQGAHSRTQRTALTPWALDPDPKPRKRDADRCGRGHGEEGGVVGGGREQTCRPEKWAGGPTH